MDSAEQIRTDPDAGARRLVADLGPGLYAFALQLCGNRTDADDLYMRTLETALARISQQRGPSFPAWLRAICANLWRMDKRRSGVPIAQEETLETVPDKGPSPAEAAEAQSDAAAVRIAVARLPARYLKPVLLRYWGGFSHPEIAARIGVSEGTVKRLLFEARELVRAELERSLERNRK